MNDHEAGIWNALVDDLATRGYAVVDDFLSPIEVETILNLDVFRQKKFKRAGVGQKSEKLVNESIRGDYIQWIDRATVEPPLKNYLNKLGHLIQVVNRNLFLSLKDYEIHLTAYPTGTFYKRHLDQFRKDDHRKLSVICYLNRDWKEEEGGQLRIYLPDDHQDVFPLAGRLICFRSDLLEHEVLPATRERLSITGWLLDRVADLPHL